ncbi:hypothetical protein BDQ12DRAFT_677351 [Crucibulum laeve]|uniref:Uncharacterized protein n=1 Tax=Crucibulum laeve TaxID=68775 RepID=A0A5C3M923_9AGAR|nr:hypothetical protein BDQ12DRAFT_677351 [Crucibulum laeve]
MSTTPGVTTSTSILMHACLAQLSNEIQTIDLLATESPFTLAHSTSSRRLILPPELLLLIRSFLLPMVTTTLLQQSALALAEYESSLRELLCPDCLAYNNDIYGPDIWQWDQFSGACACLDTTVMAQGNSTRRKWRKYGVTPDPRQFTDSQQWLEHHLSCMALRNIYGQQITPPTSSVAIWDAVTGVLRMYGCELLRDPTVIHQGPLFNSRVCKQSLKYIVRIIPLTSEIQKYDSESSSPGAELGDYGWRSYVILNRVNRDLGLSEAYLEVSCSASMPRTKISAYREFMDYPPTRWYHRHLPDAVIAAMHFITAVAAVCFSLPMTFATVALTILCYYSRPRCLRIL